MSQSPLARGIEYWCERGYMVGIVERRVARTVTQDLFGFIDFVGLGPEGDTIAVQVTSWSNFAARLRKVREHRNLARVLHCWKRVCVMGFKKGHKEPRIEWVGDSTK